jgi:ribosomal protein S21
MIKAEIHEMEEALRLFKEAVKRSATLAGG